MTSAENIAGLDVKPEPSFLWGNCRAYRVMSTQHTPHYGPGDIVLTDERGRVLGFVPAIAAARSSLA
jgi:hypothetical protein